ncbi:triose-phosphate isomerase [Candidatus Roizmanbacteria bacterium]|nr:triose-phosphate isomerase [Candidatus Roizmanbacteria bacterium]
MIFLSLKTYKEATGQAVINLLSSVKKVSQEIGIPIIPIAQATDIYRIKKELGIEVWAQHVDPIDPGKNTGWISPYSIKQAGATGVLINHSEHKVSKETVIETVQKAKEHGLKTVVIGQSPEMILDYDSLNTDYLSFEKEDLIASEVSMIDQQEKAIQDLVKILKHPLIIGAGINDGEDTKKSKAVGAVGVLMATYFVTAPDPEAKLRELAMGFK